jgi:hypothetical protein
MQRFVIALLLVVEVCGCSSAKFNSSYKKIEGSQLPSLIRETALSPMAGGYDGLLYAGSNNGYDYFIVKRGESSFLRLSSSKIRILDTETPFSINNRFKFGYLSPQNISKIINWTDPDYYYKMPQNTSPLLIHDSIYPDTATSSEKDLLGLPR